MSTQPTTSSMRRLGSSRLPAIGVAISFGGMRQEIFSWQVAIMLLASASMWGGGMVMAQNSPQKDASALASLNKMMAVTGWDAALPALNDVSVSTLGTSTALDGTEAQTTSTLRVRARTQIRADDSSGNVAYVRSGGSANVVHNGTTEALPPHVTRFFYAYMLPMLTPLTTFADPSVRLLDKGTVTIGAEQYYGIEIGELDPHPQQRQQGPLGWHAIVYLSTTTYLPYQMTVDWPSVSREHSTRPMTWIWSNYQNEKGLLVPLTTQRQIDGKIASTSVLQSLNLNTGLQDSDFPISK